MELSNLNNYINKLTENFNDFEKNNQKLNFEYELLNKKIKDNEHSLNKLNNDVKLYENSKDIINKIILKTRNEAIEFIEQVVNCALYEVFNNENLKIKLILKTEGAKTSISTYIQENNELYDIESSRGGGLRDLVSVAILICCRAICKPKIQLPLLLDESFKFLHSTKQNKFKKNAFLFLKNIASKLDTQIILITGEVDKEAIDIADNIIYVAKKNNESFLDKI